MSVEQASARAVEATAGEIDRLLSARPRLDDRLLEPADIAVLVDSHMQGSRIKRALGALGIGAVEVSRDNVLASAEGGQLLCWLAAVADPSDAGVVRSALLAVPGGLDVASLDALAEAAPSWAAWVGHFSACRETWARLGAQAALRRLLFDTGAATRLAGLLDGERRLTNLLHLFELAAASDEAAHGPRQAWRWLARARGKEAAGRDTTELRLDSDENLVRILTVHKSKGLEFPFVFLPFAWHGRKEKTQTPLVHHIGPESRSGEAASWQAVLELDDSPAPAVCEQAASEKEAESVRRLYVALTRAEQRCYVLWGHVASAAQSPLGRLLASHAQGGDCHEGLSHWQAEAPAGSIVVVEVDNEEAPRSSLDGGRRRLGAHPPAGPEPSPAADGRAAPLRARPFALAIPAPWIRTSFTGLQAKLSDERAQISEVDERPDHDEVDDRVREQGGGRATVAIDRQSADPSPEDEAFGVDASGRETARTQVPGTEAPARPCGVDIRFRFPAGARAGACLHGILEQCRFDQPLAPAWVAQHLSRAGFRDIPAEAVSQWLDEVLDARLRAPDGRAVFLRALRPDQQVREMDFLLAGHEVDDRAVLDAVAQEYPVEPGLAGPSWDGFLRGFIDLVFEQDGRWYVLDWKSNWLGDAIEAYDAAAIEASMRAHGYSLQACLYLLALHRHLRARLPGYDWDRDIGGAFWVFLRAAGRAAGSLAGGLAGDVAGAVHASKPSRELIERLDRLFGARVAAGPGFGSGGGPVRDGRAKD